MYVNNLYKKLFFFFIILSLCNFVFAFNLQNDDQAIKNFIESLENQAEPTIINNCIIFTHKPSKPTSTVYAVFSHENFQKIHTYSYYKNKNMFLLILQIPDDIKSLNYRQNVNGLWSTDSSNPNKTLDKHGFQMSEIVFRSQDLEERIQSPHKLNSQKYKFTYVGKPNSLITLSGDFNSWDPFMYKMQETKPGHYSIEIEIVKENFFYYFLDNGEKILDVFNNRKKFLSVQGEVNFFERNSIFG